MLPLKVFEVPNCGTIVVSIPIVPVEVIVPPVTPVPAVMLVTPLAAGVVKPRVTVLPLTPMGRQDLVGRRYSVWQSQREASAMLCAATVTLPL